ncbi:unnamed protein product [Chrysoparadoxa australica]
MESDSHTVWRAPSLGGSSDLDSTSNYGDQGLAHSFEVGGISELIEDITPFSQQVRQEHLRQVVKAAHAKASPDACADLAAFKSAHRRAFQRAAGTSPANVTITNQEVQPGGLLERLFFGDTSKGNDGPNGPNGNSSLSAGRHSRPMALEGDEVGAVSFLDLINAYLRHTVSPIEGSAVVAAGLKDTARSAASPRKSLSSTNASGEGLARTEVMGDWEGFDEPQHQSRRASDGMLPPSLHQQQLRLHSLEHNRDHPSLHHHHHHHHNNQQQQVERRGSAPPTLRSQEVLDELEARRQAVEDALVEHALAEVAGHGVQHTVTAAELEKRRLSVADTYRAAISEGLLTPPPPPPLHHDDCNDWHKTGSSSTAVDGCPASSTDSGRSDGRSEGRSEGRRRGGRSSASPASTSRSSQRQRRGTVTSSLRGHSPTPSPTRPVTSRATSQRLRGCAGGDRSDNCNSSGWCSCNGAAAARRMSTGVNVGRMHASNNGGPNGGHSECSMAVACNADRDGATAGGAGGRRRSCHVCGREKGAVTAAVPASNNRSRRHSSTSGSGRRESNAYGRGGSSRQLGYTFPAPQGQRRRSSCHTCGCCNGEALLGLPRWDNSTKVERNFEPFSRRKVPKDTGRRWSQDTPF